MKTAGSLVIPVFPTVYSSGVNLTTDKPYFDVILNEAGIRKNDKVLVVGPGTGADAWAAWLRCRAEVFAIDINPLAVANTLTTARLAGFNVKVIEGDITRTNLPGDFSGFDFVLWNMPLLNDRDFKLTVPAEVFHDGDDGMILDAFIQRLPLLLKKGGTAVIWNSRAAMERVPFEKKVFEHGRLAVCVIRMPD